MNEDIKTLRSELALLKLQFSERIGYVESRLNNLIEQEEPKAQQVTPSIAHVEGNSPLVKKINAPELTLGKAPTNASINKQVHYKEYERAPKKPSFIMVALQSFIGSFLEWFSPVTKIYQSYKERGMLGIFLLTITGIGLTLAGFGYLMQLLIDELGAGSKSLLMGCAAIAVLGVGVALKIKTRFSEFATAIVTLGILIAYSTIYFSGSVYGLLPNIAVLISYLLIALLCHAIALWFDTKVTAALGIIGIATMPILSGTMVLEPLYYLLSFTFVVISSLLLAFRQVGHWLAQLSLAFTVVALEWIIGFENVLISAWAVNLFYLLFFGYVVASIIKEKIPFNKLLVFLAALVTSTVLVFFQATNIYTLEITVNFAFNALLAAVVSIFFYKVKRQLAPFFILLAASWGVLSAVSAISDAYWGVAWAVEGLLLLVIGRVYKIPATVNQGQILTAIALLYSFIGLAMYFPVPALTSIDGWLLSIIIVIVIGVWQRVINATDVFNQLTQHKIKPLLQLFEVIWLSILIITSANLWIGDWTGALVIIVQLALLFRAKQCKQVSIEIFAALLILVPLFYAYQGVLLVDSYRFSMLPLFAKLSLVSAFIQLWLWSAFQRKYNPESSMKSIAEAVRILFYMIIPIVWVSAAIRRLDEVAIVLLWLSPLLALFFARKVGHHILIKEAKVLTAIASICLVIVTCTGQLSLLHTFLSVIGFIGVYAVAYVLNRKTPNDLYQFICSWGLLSLGVTLPVIIGFQLNGILYAGIFAALYWAFAFSNISTSLHCKRNEWLITIINIALIVASWVCISFNATLAIVPALFLITTLYKKEQRFTLSKINSALNQKGDLFLHTIFAITYVILFYGISQYRCELLIAPALAIHGALILFLKDRQLPTVKFGFALIGIAIVKLAMVDAANALLWQKVILFMGIGVFILIASFWYQKLINSSLQVKIDE